MASRLREAVEAYIETHWGELPDHIHEIEDERYEGSTLVELGELVSVTYRTAKGDEQIHDYEHEFGEEGGDPPILAIDEDGRLAILGGDYIINERGIID